MSRHYQGNPKYIPGLLFVLLCAAACEPQQTAEDAEKAAAIENVDAMSREHANDTATPSEGARIAAERPVVAEKLAYAEVGDDLSYGHFVIPTDMVKPLPAVIVIHEWWGLNDGVRAMADRLAGLGYIVLAVDLFGGKTATTPGDARALMMEVVEDPESANENIRQAYDFVRNTAGAPRVASLGWCFGGGWSLNTALLFPEELDAAVIYYGRVTTSESRLRPLSVPILGIFGAEDSGIPVDSVRGFEKALENLGKDYEIEIYPDVGHAFANPSGNNYNAEAADKAWEQTVAFLNRHLHGPTNSG
ncbi:MAG: dienelactone hydrolase family protein [Woeseia sp.]